MSPDEIKFPGCNHQLGKRDSGKMTLVLHIKNQSFNQLDNISDFSFDHFSHKSKIQFHQVDGFFID